MRIEAPTMLSISLRIIGMRRRRVNRAAGGRRRERRRASHVAEGHEEPVARPQGDPWVQYHALAGDQIQSVALRNGREGELRLHHGEPVPNALARTAAEGEV